MVDDLRYAFRQLRKNPGFAAIAVLTLGLGIGAAAAIFGLIQGVLLSPPPYADPDRLVVISPARVDGKPYDQGSTIGQWIAWRSGARSIEPPALYRWTFNFLVLPDGSKSLGGMSVNRDYFRTLGIKPILGREIAESEMGRSGPGNAPKAIMLGYELWKTQFNGDPNILGQAVRISRMPAPLPVVGITPPGIRFLPDPGNSSEPNYDVNAFVDFWLVGVPDESQPKARGWNAVARLRDGATVAQAQAEIPAITLAYNRTDPTLDGLTSTVRALPDELNQEGRRLLIPLFGSVGLVFLIACGNVAGLMLGRGLQRQQEYALRSALGAGRWRLFRQIITESVTLALVGAMVGVVFAGGLIALLKAIGGHAVPRLDAVTVRWPVFAFGFVTSLVAAVVAGLLPAVRASVPDRAHGLDGTRTASVGRAERRLLGSVTTFQIVMTVALLAGAALLVRTAYNLATVRPGYDTQNILAMAVTYVGEGKGRKDFHVRALERVSALPGVKHAAFVWGVPLTGNKWTIDMSIVGQADASKYTDRLNLASRSVTPDYFAAMGIEMTTGRAFRVSDDETAPRVMIVNNAFARRYFPGSSPIGHQMKFVGDDKTIVEIIGEVADTRTEALSAQAEPELYFPFWQMGAFSKSLILRTTTDPKTLMSLVRRELSSVDPTASVEHMQTMEQIRSASVAPRTFAMNLLGGFAVAATLLALVGIYGVLSLSVGSRTKELAVRKAIGAQSHEILRLVLNEGFKLIALGVTLGTILALMLGSVLKALLFEVQPTDPLTLTATAAAFAIIGLAACALPAWRAARVDLMEALRQQ
jgi:putative ABC transport system permease protein